MSVAIKGTSMVLYFSSAMVHLVNRVLLHSCFAVIRYKFTIRIDTDV